MVHSMLEHLPWIGRDETADLRSDPPQRVQRPAFGLTPWLAFLRRALAFSFLVRFDIGRPRYCAAPQATNRSASQVLMICSASAPASAALSQP